MSVGCSVGERKHGGLHWLHGRQGREGDGEGWMVSM